MFVSKCISTPFSILGKAQSTITEELSTFGKLQRGLQPNTHAEVSNGTQNKQSRL